MNPVVRASGEGKNILCVRARGDCKAIRHAPFVVAFHCCSCSGIVQMDSGGVRRGEWNRKRLGGREEEKKKRSTELSIEYYFKPTLRYSFSGLYIDFYRRNRNIAAAALIKRDPPPPPPPPPLIDSSLFSLFSSYNLVSFLNCCSKREIYPLSLVQKFYGFKAFRN